MYYKTPASVKADHVSLASYFIMANSDITVIIALIVSLIALFVAFGQFLQQIFGTADGYRRCQSSVIGPWSNLKRSHWRWSEFRYETIVTTPHFIMSDWTSHSDSQEGSTRNKRSWKGIHDIVRARLGRIQTSSNEGDKDVPLYILGNAASMKMTLTTLGICGLDKSVEKRNQDIDTEKAQQNEQIEPSLDHTYFSKHPDLANWLALLPVLHWYTADALFGGAPQLSDGKVPYKFPKSKFHPPMVPSYPLVPSIVMKQHSWDLIPPSVVKPLASSTVGYVVALGHRMRMTWKELKLEEGAMTAEGFGLSFVSTKIHGVGIVIQFSCSISKPLDHSMMLIPTAAADMMHCGIIPGDPELEIQDYDIVLDDNNVRNKDMTGIENLLKDLNVSAEKIAVLINDDNRNLWEQFGGLPMFEQLLPGFSDVMPMLAPFMPLPGSRTVKCKNPIRQAIRGPLTWGQGWIIMQKRLNGMKRSAQMNQVFNHLTESMTDPYKDLYKQGCFAENLKTAKEEEFVHLLRCQHRSTTEYFQELKSNITNFRFKDLVAAHIHMAVDAASQDSKQENHGKPASWMDDRCYTYVDMVDKVVINGIKPEIVQDAWWTLMLRCFTWSRSVYLVDKWVPGWAPQKAAVYRSQIPVWLS